MEQAAITRTVGVAAGGFAPGHIGELTRIVPFEMVDEVLAETGAVQRRVRLMPARVTVYLLLAAALFNGLGYQQVFDRLCAGLAGLPLLRPSGSALRLARQRLGPAPMKALFHLVSGPAATTAAAGRWRGLRVVAVDGTLLPVPDCPANLAVFTRQRLGNGTSGYPQLRLAALVACGTKSKCWWADSSLAGCASMGWTSRCGGGLAVWGDRVGMSRLRSWASLIG